MALTINTNIPSLIVQRNLNAATNALNISMERMTTGYKINHARDNAAGYSIADNWTTQIGSIDIAAQNAAMGLDMLTTAEENYALITGHLQRVRDLTEQAANGTYGSASLKAIHSEIYSRLQEISRIASNAEFNGIKLMSDGSTASNGIDLQVGLYADGNSIIALDSTLFGDASISGLLSGISGLTTIVTNANGGSAPSSYNSDGGYKAIAAAFSGLKISGNDLVIQTTVGSLAKDTLPFIDEAINNISKRVTMLGAAQNRVNSAISALDVQSENLTSSLSTIKDTDVAAESSAYIKAQILQQASATLLSTANQAPSIALNLI